MVLGSHPGVEALGSHQYTLGCVEGSQWFGEPRSSPEETGWKTKVTSSRSLLRQRALACAKAHRGEYASES